MVAVDYEGLQEVLNIVICLGNFCYVGKLVAEETCLLTRGGRNRRFDCNNNKKITTTTTMPNHLACQGFLHVSITNNTITIHKITENLLII